MDHVSNLMVLELPNNWLNHLKIKHTWTINQKWCGCFPTIICIACRAFIHLNTVIQLLFYSSLWFDGTQTNSLNAIHAFDHNVNRCKQPNYSSQAVPAMAIERNISIASLWIYIINNTSEYGSAS